MDDIHIGDQDLFFHAGSIGTESTNLNFTVWVLESIGDGIPIVKISKDNSPRPEDIIANISIERVPRIINGNCSSNQLIQISNWINLNLEGLLLFWTIQDEYDFWDDIKPNL